MPVQIHLNGQRYFADDGTDPAELQQYAQMHQQEQAQLNPINQGMQNVFSGINRQIQNYNELPAPTAVPGNTYGMSTQAFNQTAGIIQQDNMNSATARMQQRVQMEQAMEQEKDRAQQIKVQDMQFKNQQRLENFKMKQEEARLKREGMTPKPIPLAGGGIAEYTPGAGGQQGTITTLREPAVKPITKSYTTMYGADGTAYGVNRADPSEVIPVKDPITGEPIRRTAGQTGKRLVNDASGIPYLLDMATGDMEPAQVPEGFAAKSPAQNNAELRDRRAFILRDVQNKENRYFKDYGSLDGFDRIAAESEASAAYDRVAGTAGGAPAAPQTPQATIKIGDTYTGDDGKQYRYVGGNKGEPVEQATQGFDPFANPGVYTPPQPAAPQFDMMNTIAAQNTGASPTAANVLQVVQSQDAAADAAAKARAQELHAKLSKLTPRVINAALSQEPPSVQSWYRAINSAAMGQVGSNNPEQVTQGFRPVTPVSTLR